MLVLLWSSFGTFTCVLTRQVILQKLPSTCIYIYGDIDFFPKFVILQCDLLDMPAVGQLENDEKYTLTYQLLKIFLTHRLDAYLDFQSANSALLKSYGMLLPTFLLLL